MGAASPYTRMQLSPALDQPTETQEAVATQEPSLLSVIPETDPRVCLTKHYTHRLSTNGSRSISDNGICALNPTARRPSPTKLAPIAMSRAVEGLVLLGFTSLKANQGRSAWCVYVELLERQGVPPGHSTIEIET